MSQISHFISAPSSPERLSANDSLDSVNAADSLDFYREMSLDRRTKEAEREALLPQLKDGETLRVCVKCEEAWVIKISQRSVDVMKHQCAE